ncbi:hypothetical protein LZK98_19095 [Sphingomonas cannabina]|uniref:hypothetical protein n=1 Tax=Sphingomonas cannabina TaxID=2899123 RepID=UPI001F251232|nr:hypothetical protein [Sphingomonas cannabina]UIJ45125.1 hypothetical protein LZK98_19095 [Sphingomonas cannabina]
MGTDQLYLHIRVVMSIILGLGITTLLKGVAAIIVHPKRYRWSWIHMSWVVWTLVSIVTFWWWEFRLAEVARWTFGSYLFVIAYCSCFFMLSALLFPEDVQEYGSYEGYLLERRAWFFGLIALMTLMDLADTSLKGASRWHALGWLYPMHIAVMLAVAGLGAWLKDKQAQLVLALAALGYQLVYYGIEYFTLATE